jgi:hypothetical protein
MGQAMERSTWDSAARCMPASGRKSANSARIASASEISALGKAVVGFGCEVAQGARVADVVELVDVQDLMPTPREGGEISSC